MHFAERQDDHLIDDLWFSYKILKIHLHHFWQQYQSGPDFSEMNKNADLIFIAV